MSQQIQVKKIPHEAPPILLAVTSQQFQPQNNPNPVQEEQLQRLRQQQIQIQKEWLLEKQRQKQVKKLQNHCFVLKIPLFLAKNLQKLDTDEIKKSFTKLIRQFRHDKQKRIQINQAYQSIIRKYYKIEYSFDQEWLILYVVKEKHKRLQSCLEQKPSLLSFRMKGTNYPLLYFAARGGCFEIVQTILKMGYTRHFENDRSTPMHCAAYYGHFQILKLLIQYGIPVNLKNFSGNLPVNESATVQIKKILIQEAEKNLIHKLIQQLQTQKLCLTTRNIEEQGKIIATKIILHSYIKRYDEHVDAFHGTSFQNLKSIAKYGLKKPGDIVQGKVIKIVPGHIKDKKWANTIFVSPSLLYAGNSVYSNQITNITNSQRQIWLPIVQVKVKNNSFLKYQSTTPSYKPKVDESKIFQYRLQMNSKADKQNVTVVALLLIRKEYLQSIKKYETVRDKFQNWTQEIKFRQRLSYMVK